MLRQLREAYRTIYGEECAHSAEYTGWSEIGATAESVMRDRVVRVVQRQGCYTAHVVDMARCIDGPAESTVDAALRAVVDLASPPKRRRGRGEVVP